MRAGNGWIGYPQGDSNAGSGPAHTSGSYDQDNVNMVFEAVRRIDFFIGPEYTRARDVTQDFGGLITSTVDYSFRFAGASFGLRFKPVASRRWHLYLAAGAIAGKIHYRADFGPTGLTPLSSNENTVRFVRPRLGFGMMIALTEKISAGAELAFTDSPPSYQVTVLNNNTGEIEQRKFSDNAQMFGVSFGLRYAFGN